MVTITIRTVTIANYAGSHLLKRDIVRSSAAKFVKFVVDLMEMCQNLTAIFSTL
jgi:hypothetical protein